MASWRDKMRPAQFRDAPFFVREVSLEGFHRGVIHRYPYQNKAYVQPMGQGENGFPVEGFLWGDDYFTARDKLLSALEKGEVGELKHPYYGSKKVFPLRWRFTNSAEEGGMVTVSIDFIETPAQPVQPSAIADNLGAVQAKAKSTLAKAREEFLATYQKGAASLFAVQGALTNVTKTLSTPLVVAELAEAQVAALKSQTAALVRTAAAVVRLPERLFDDLAGVFGFLTSIPGLLNAYNYEKGDRPIGSTPTRRAEQASFDSFQRAMQQLATIQAVTSSIVQEFGGFERALSARQQLTDLIDEQSALCGDDLFQQFQDLRATLVQALPSKNAPHLLTYTPRSTLPSLVICQRLYGDVSFEQDLLDRNSIQRPGFVRGGESLELVARV